VVLDRALRLLEAIVSDRGRTSLSGIAARVRIPAATAYRLAGALVARRYLARLAGGRYHAGSVMLSLGTGQNARTVLRAASEPTLDWLARRFKSVAHVGVFESGMVSYVCKSGVGRSARFTREGTQLDAYCSALGKVLLAHLRRSEREAYLAGGPFPKLTCRTISDPQDLSAHLREVRKQGYALDDREFAEELRCIAVPVRNGKSRVCAALSITTSPERLRAARTRFALALLRRAARDIEIRISGVGVS
jgi:IclR family transcriptional regulator, acetate operon repressor